MSALIPGDECARVYSILGTRPFRNAGAGLSSGRFDPRHLPGCQLLACGNTAAFPTAVVIPAITSTDDDMEAAGTVAYTATNCNKAKIGGAHSGAQCLELTNTAVNGNVCTATTSTYTVGNRVRNVGWAKSGDGTGVPAVYENGATLLWQGTASTDWQAYDTGWYTVTGPLRFYTIGAIGLKSCWDDMTWSTQNASQFTDLSGNGRPLVQAAAASQPLATVSGSGYYLSTDGVADRMNVAYASNQPRTRYCLARVTVQASARTIFDGNAADSGSLKHKAGSTTTQCNAGSAFDGPALTDNAWHLFCQVLNGAASAISIDGGAFTTGDAGAGNPGGIYLGCGGGAAAGTFAVARYAAFADFAGAHDLATVQRMYRWALRQKAMLAL